MGLLGWPNWVLLMAGIVMVGCASIPGSSVDEQMETIDALVSQTLADLYETQPSTKGAIAASVGYAVMKGTETKLPLIGAGSGYGVAIHTRTEEKTYLEITEFAMGAGLGRTASRFVLIFQDQAIFNRFTSGFWKLRKSMEASAKSMDGGTLAGAQTAKDAASKGYSVHFIADSGASARATLGVFRAKPIQLKK